MWLLLVGYGNRKGSGVKPLQPYHIDVLLQKMNKVSATKIKNTATGVADLG
jgi:phosphopantetheine adenylyltransferase